MRQQELLLRLWLDIGSVQRVARVTSVRVAAERQGRRVAVLAA